MVSRELFERFPAARAALAWEPLATLPTPLESRVVDGHSVRIKRDDLTGARYGGNKVRKLEFLLGAARAAGAERVVTAGAFGSHHALATTLYARQLGMHATVVLFPQRITAHVREIVLACASLGAEVRFTRRMEGVPFALWRTRLEYGSKACVIPPGGSDATGALGYVEAGLELARQLNADRADIERIHVAAGTLGTVAGLATGLALAGNNATIHATRITSRLVANERVMRKLIEGVLSKLAALAEAGLPSATSIAARVHIADDRIGAGYGHATTEGDDACAKFAEAGLELDATYTAKAAASFLADAATNAGKTVFIHTLSSAHPATEEAFAAIDRLPPEIATRLERYSNDTGENDE